MDIYVYLSYKAKQIIPDSSVNEVTGWQAEIFLPIYEPIFLVAAKKGSGFEKSTAIPVQIQRFPGGLGSQISRQPVVSLSALGTDHLYWYSLLLEAESTPWT